VNEKYTATELFFKLFRYRQAGLFAGTQFLTFSAAEVFLPQLIKIHCNNSFNTEFISQLVLTCLSEHFRVIHLIVF